MAKTPHSRGKNEGDGNGSHLKEQPSERLRIGLVDYGSLRGTLKVPNNVLHSRNQSGARITITYRWYFPIKFDDDAAVMAGQRGRAKTNHTKTRKRPNQQPM
ncbi:MAG: hypothetical protein COC14_00810 [Burkholderiaceae bacterium]|jgi:hypothetical protein|uniref:Uncharacterized protein n=1 Tax=Cupriavidus metallidurans TaxID=119219 RepID=A0A482IXV4_9BURK|nr:MULTISPECIES: hypothetical protein [Cupriavidus]PCH58656.1 MAG: hypothetical protein COC14_00810 [Burkholderiaceae bacterium]QBP13925.1 hypothetical protein DDF84_030785 [Cupriavidus metallidurans]QWC91706.1 hypothetical protein KB891_18250 [Cupriavidus metallidurans]